MNVNWLPHALSQLRHYPRQESTRIVRKVAWYASQEDPLSFAVVLRGRQLGSHRFRVGGYRVIFDVNRSTNTLDILAVSRRDQAYRS